MKWAPDVTATGKGAVSLVLSVCNAAREGHLRLAGFNTIQGARSGVLYFGLSVFWQAPSDTSTCSPFRHWKGQGLCRPPELGGRQARRPGSLAAARLVWHLQAAAGGG